MSDAPAFGDRVRGALGERGPLCVGIDPHEHLLRAWELDASAAGVREFGLRTVDAAAGRAGIVKPQVSFFERYGSAGFAALEDVLAAARAAGLLVIADAKRGDIGTTMDAYTRAWLTPGSPLEADAITVSPYLGVLSLVDTFRFALAHGKGVFVLAATSNPEAHAQQRAIVGGERTIAAEITREVSGFNAVSTVPGEWASIGFVIGATVDWADAGLPAQIAPIAPILAPGFGHQGAKPGELAGLFGSAASAVIASESRSLLAAGPDGLAAAIDARVREYRSSHG
ncbi:MAG TPA: orotidine-5'-phosphate decarboxylase [Microbacterium sp.]|uniref:orotidine-5'-phosphate decarboxylase n=1 Tax=Microbacterium sp. TaxID=51671 RepID=UPI002BE18709|nr:orotidine-5'-phosphate decarboxylase [Microbacterium sp.]HWI30727.1 orotidine-5'-phosphate decarboxylase [Microbacterium sp.]